MTWHRWAHGWGVERSLKLIVPQQPKATPEAGDSQGRRARHIQGLQEPLSDTGGAVGRVFAAVVGWTDTTVAALGGPVRGDSVVRASQRERASYSSDPPGVRLVEVASSEIVPVWVDGCPWWSVAEHLLGGPLLLPRPGCGHSVALQTSTSIVKVGVPVFSSTTHKGNSRPRANNSRVRVGDAGCSGPAAGVARSC
jgi:hypothetical protein